MDLKNIDKLRGNFFGGVTAGIVALPLALAFGVASGAGPAAGLYGAMAVGFFAALLGGTPTQVSGPTGPMTVVAAAALVSFGGDLSALMAVTIMAGGLQIVFGMTRLGSLVRFMPYPVISGFMTGIGAIIILLQLSPLIGAAPLSSPLAAIVHLGDSLAQFNPAAAGLGLITMAIVFLCPARITRVAPSPLIALVVGTVLTWALDLPVKTIGSIPAGLPMPSLPMLNLDMVGKALGLALALAALGSIDTLLTSIVADSLTKTRHNPNRELIGQGIGNMVAGLIGGLPGAGATMRTVVNIKAGGNSRVSGMIHALLLVALLLGLAPLAAHIPMCVLAGILIKVGVDILDYRLLRLGKAAPRLDFAVMLVVFLITVFVDLMVAVGVGITLASLMINYRVTRIAQLRVAEPENGHGWSQESDELLQSETDYGLMVLTIRGPFFFGSAAQMQDKVAELLSTRVVVIDCLEVQFLDISASFALSEMLDKLHSSGVRTLLVLTPEQKARLFSVGLGDQIGEQDVFHRHEEALQASLGYLRETA